MKRGGASGINSTDLISYFALFEEFSWGLGKFQKTAQVMHTSTAILLYLSDVQKATLRFRVLICSQIDEDVILSNLQV